MSNSQFDRFVQDEAESSLEEILQEDYPAMKVMMRSLRSFPWVEEFKQLKSHGSFKSFWSCKVVLYL
jgi:mRNA-degrading endonuclease YafQ of YafQ-DinJ toxin-antitoxin module